MSFIHNVVEKVEEHPYITAGTIIGVGLVIILIMHTSSNGGTASDTSSNYAQTLADEQAQEVAANTQLSQAQLQYQAQSNSVNEALAATQTNDAAQVQLATLQAQTQQNADSLSAATAQAANSLSAQVAETESTLEAQVSQTQVNTAAQVALTEANLSAYTQIATNNTNAAISSQLISADQQTMNAQINAASQTQALIASLKS